MLSEIRRQTNSNQFRDGTSVFADTVTLDRVDDKTGALACTVQYRFDVPSMIGAAAADNAWQVVNELKALIKSKGPTSGSIHYTVKPTVDGGVWVNIVPAGQALSDCVIASNDGFANVRATPGGMIIDLLTNGDAVYSTGKTSRSWVQVTSNRARIGYVSNGLIICD